MECKKMHCVNNIKFTKKIISNLMKNALLSASLRFFFSKKKFKVVTGSCFYFGNTENQNQQEIFTRNATKHLHVPVSLRNTSRWTDEIVSSESGGNVTDGEIQDSTLKTI
jgi:hypothetical protein